MFDFDEKREGRKSFYPGQRRGQCAGRCSCYKFPRVENGVEYKGVAYSYGNKDTRWHFAQKLTDALNQPHNVDCEWGKYNAYKPGIHKNELDYYKTNCPSSWLDSLKKWAGIDCSGLVQRCAYHAGFTFIYAPNFGNIGSGNFNEFGGELSVGELESYTDSVDTANWRINVWEGDIVFYGSYHCGIISFVGRNSGETEMIHAYGGEWAKRSVRRDVNLWKFGRFKIRRFKWGTFLSGGKK